jgi:lipoprotein-anchoring transpeptidase ErfK/SrfK
MQTEEQLGTFQSGGCIRMADRDAEFLFNFAELGTTVVVLK